MSRYVTDTATPGHSLNRDYYARRHLIAINLIQALVGDTLKRLHISVHFLFLLLTEYSC